MHEEKKEIYLEILKADTMKQTDIKKIRKDIFRWTKKLVELGNKI